MQKSEIGNFHRRTPLGTRASAFFRISSFGIRVSACIGRAPALKREQVVLKLCGRQSNTRGCSSVVERHVANVNVEGSTPFTRFENPSPPDGFFSRLFSPVATVMDELGQSSVWPMTAPQQPVTADSLVTLSLRPARRTIAASRAPECRPDTIRWIAGTSIRCPAHS